MTSEEGDSALHNMLKDGYCRLALNRIPYSDVNKVWRGQTPLFCLLWYHRFHPYQVDTLLSALLSHGANPNEPVVTELIDWNAAGFLSKHRAPRLCYPLHLAVMYYCDTIPLFLAYGADMEKRDDCDCTPLERAVMYGEGIIQNPAIDHLLKAGAIVRPISIYTACRRRCLNTVRKLLRHYEGFLPDLCEGESMLAAAAYSENDHLIVAIIDRLQNVSAESFCRTIAGDHGRGPLICKQLIEKGLNNLLADENRYWTPLALAVLQGQKRTVKILLDAGYDPWNGQRGLSITTEGLEAILVEDPTGDYDCRSGFGNVTAEMMTDVAMLLQSYQWRAIFIALAQFRFGQEQYHDYRIWRTIRHYLPPLPRRLYNVLFEF